MSNTLFRATGAALGAAAFLLAGPAAAEEFYCEVLAMEGTATVSNQTISGKPLQEGDLLQAEDTIQVGPDSYVDLAYDSEWSNVTRLEENSKLRIRSIYPVELDLDSGGVYANLKQLPKESSFEVRTPTAIASVRGTEYRTTFVGGETQIFNSSDSDVYVYGLDEAGAKQAEPVVLKSSQKTQVIRRGAQPVAPRRMETHEFKPLLNAREKIQNKIQKIAAQGRVGKIQNIRQMEERGVGGRRPRGEVKTLSGEEARNAAMRLVEPAEEQPPVRERELSQEEPREYRDAPKKLGEFPEHEELRREADRAVQDVLKDDRSGIDRDKVEKLRQKVDQAIQNSPPEERKKLEQMQKMVQETVEKVAQARREHGGGQPFGPDPGRRPSDGDFQLGTIRQGPGQAAGAPDGQKQGAGRPAAKQQGSRPKDRP